MKQVNSPASKVKFAALYFVSLLLIIVILSAFWGPLPTLPKKIAETNLTAQQSEEHQVLLAMDRLHSQYSDLVQLVGEDSMATPSIENSAKVNTIKNALKKTIDSVQANSLAYRKESKKMLTNIIEPLKLAIDNLHFAPAASIETNNPQSNIDPQKKDSLIAELEKQVKAGTKSSLNEQEMAALKIDLQNKNSRITELEKQANSRANSLNDQREVTALKSDLKSKNARIIELEKQVNLKANSLNDQREVIALKNDLKNKNARISELENQVKSRANSSNGQAELIALKSDLKNKNSRITQLENQVKSSANSNNQADLTALQRDLKNRDARINALEKQLKNMPVASNTNSHAEVVKKLESDNKYYQLALKSQVIQTNKLLETNKSLKSNIDELNRRLNKSTSN